MHPHSLFLHSQAARRRRAARVRLHGQHGAAAGQAAGGLTRLAGLGGRL